MCDFSKLFGNDQKLTVMINERNLILNVGISDEL